MAAERWWEIWASSRWPEDEGQPYRIGRYRSEVDARKAAEQWPNLSIWIKESTDA